MLQSGTKTGTRMRGERLGFRIDPDTKTLVEHAAQLERRKLTDYCLSALSEAARRTIAQHESLTLTEADRAIFFDVLVNPPSPNERLERAFVSAARRLAPQVPGRSAADLRVEPLGPAHDRVSFVCGVDSLDAYLRTQASQDVRRKANAVFVMVASAAPETILGYFALCATALSQGDIPEPARKLVPRYPLVSATLLGRLAVASVRQGEGLGATLLASALRKACDSADSVGSCMVVVDAIDGAAAAFYAAHGFIQLAQSPRLILPMRTIGALASRA